MSSLGNKMQFDRIRQALTSGFLCVALVAGALALPAAAMAQAASAWDAIVAAAKKEGRLTLYSGAVPAVTDRLKPDFENAFPGIKLGASGGQRPHAGQTRD